MKKLFLLLGLVFLLTSKSKAQFKDQLTTNASNSLIILKTLSNINSIDEKSYLTINTLPDKDQDFYLRRSKNQRIVGWSTLAGGLLLSGVGLLAASSSTNYNGGKTAGVLVVAGAASGIVSIPFMIMASVNKQKAKAMISSQKTGFGVPANVSKDIVGISFSIPVGN